MIGKVLADRYRVLERIGGGGMALVYRAEDLQLGRNVAIKLLRGQLGSDEEFIRRFRREAQNAASLSHPSVVQIYDVGRDEDQYFIVMELVEGKTLKAVIQEQGPLPIAEAARIAGEILGALSHAHMHRIVHRDIKPHNILISKDGRVKVTDFGIARATTTDTVTHTGSIMGSAHYFSPEQANGQPTGDRSDIYSVGIVLYEMVTGVVPFQGESPITVALKHIRERVGPPSQLNPEVPVELEEIILRALEKDPEDRYPSAAAMQEEIYGFMQAHAFGRTRIQSGDFPTMDMRALKPRKTRRELEVDEEEDEEPEEQPVSKRPSGRPAGRPRRRLRAWIWITAVALVVVGAIGVGAWKLVDFLAVPEVIVPEIVGLSLTKAQEELEAVGLQVGMLGEPKFSDTVPIQGVIRSQPEPGDSVKRGRKIALEISKGPEMRQVPDVRDQLETDARLQLENEKFEVGPSTYKSATAPKGQVLEVIPPPTTPLKVGSMVTLVVSSGPLKVPQTYGQPLDEAKRLLTEAGLTPGAVAYVPDAANPKDTVLSSDPPRDTVVVPGQVVLLTVSQGPVPDGQPFDKVITLPGDPAKTYEVKIVQVDMIAGMPTEGPVLVNGRYQGLQQVQVTGTYYGNAYLKLIINGSEQQPIPLP